jgi:hypothetical protein
LPVKRLKLEANFRQGKKSGLNILVTEKLRFDQKYFRVSSNLTDQIIGSFFYRRNDYYNDSNLSDKNFLTRNERVLINFSQEHMACNAVNFEYSLNILVTKTLRLRHSFSVGAKTQRNTSFIKLSL